MKHSEFVETGNLVFSITTEKERQRDGFLSFTILTFQISGKLTLETSGGKITTRAGDMLLVRKNQFVKVAKSPSDWRALPNSNHSF